MQSIVNRTGHVYDIFSTCDCSVRDWDPLIVYAIVKDQLSLIDRDSKFSEGVEGVGCGRSIFHNCYAVVVDADLIRVHH